MANQRAGTHSTGYLDVVLYLLTTETDIDYVDFLSWTALLQAVILGDGGPIYQEIVGLLLQADTDSSIADKESVTPLVHVGSRGQAEIVKLFERARLKAKQNPLFTSRMPFKINRFMILYPHSEIEHSATVNGVFLMTLSIRNLMTSTCTIFVTILCTIINSSFANSNDRFSQFYKSGNIFIEEIEKSKKYTPIESKISGLTIPHHLFAIDLIARGFNAISKNEYNNIFIIGPDHFRASNKPFATTRKSFDTVFGEVKVNNIITDYMITNHELFEDSDLFQKEHSFRSVIPFLKFHFPNSEIIPIAIRVDATKGDLDVAISVISKLARDSDLIIQSTDFSHFLPQRKAILRDQETLNLIAANDAIGILGLKHPDHADSLAAQYMQMRIQSGRFGAEAVVLENKNSQEYISEYVDKTTSYIVQLFTSKNKVILDSKNHTNDSEGVILFGGDTLIGRNNTSILKNDENSYKLKTQILDITRGVRLVVNLEGVMLETIPSNMPKDILKMDADLTIRWLKSLNVVAVSLANNHSQDLGEVAYSEMKDTLDDASILVAEHGKVLDIGLLRIVALNDIPSPYSRSVRRLELNELAGYFADAKRAPVFSYMHWGEEFTRVLGDRELEIAEKIHSLAISAIVGAHSHQPSSTVKVFAGGELPVIYSVGNFIFDQYNRNTGGALLEVRVFTQGTFALRLLPFPKICGHRKVELDITSSGVQCFVLK